MPGYRDRAREAAERAVALAPDVERTQIMLGFANLVEFRTGPAKAAFERAIELAPADPLPRLGLGLAQIRDGDLQEGRQNLEVAVGLDSNDSLLRAYLGKAYFEEKRDAARHRAVRISPRSSIRSTRPPTSTMAIRQQTENQPGRGSARTSRSRSSSTTTAPSTAAGCCWIPTAPRAAPASPGSTTTSASSSSASTRRPTSMTPTIRPIAAAHRFLSDSYVGVRRREIARVSELLQAQMLQDININPVQPSLSEANLNIVDPGRPGGGRVQRVHAPVRAQQVQVNTTGVVGNDDTLRRRGRRSRCYMTLSVSAGAFGYTPTAGVTTAASIRTFMTRSLSGRSHPN